MPAGARIILEENGQRVASNSTRKFPASEIQETWSPSSSTTTCGTSPTSTGRSAIFSLRPDAAPGPPLLILLVHRDDSTLPGKNSCEHRHNTANPVGES